MAETKTAEPVYEIAVRFLDPSLVRATRDRFGKVNLFDGEREFEEVRVTRAFPHSAPDLFISIAASDGKEIGMLEDLAQVSPASAQAIRNELELVYFSPRIQRIDKVTQNYGATSWWVQTDRGEHTIQVKERGDIRWLSGTKVVMTDVHGVRYEIENITALDEDSRTRLEQEA
jgi:hypothetical protein